MCVFSFIYLYLVSFCLINAQGTVIAREGLERLGVVHSTVFYMANKYGDVYVLRSCHFYYCVSTLLTKANKL